MNAIRIPDKTGACHGPKHKRGDKPDSALAWETLKDSTQLPFKILLVDTSGRQGGAERSLSLLIEELACNGVEVILVTPSKVSSCESRNGMPVHIIRTCRFLPRRRLSLFHAFVLACRWLVSIVVVLLAIMKFRPRLVHANTTAAMLAALIPARLTRRPLIWHVRDMADLGWVGRLCGRQVAAVVAVSRALRQQLIKQGVPQDKVHVVYNGVETSFGQDIGRCKERQLLRERLGFPSDAFVCLNLGQFVHWKQQDVFLRAAVKVSGQCEQARFLVMGGQPWGECRAVRLELEALAKQLGIVDHTVVSDWREDIQSVLAAADVLVHTAKEEPFGRVIIEAMQAGVPVVAVRAGGPMEIIQDERSGLLAEPGDIEGLSSRILRLQRDERLGKRLREGGFQRVREEFTAAQSAGSIRSLYRQVLAAWPNAK